MKTKKIFFIIIILVFQKLVFSQETKTYYSQDTIPFSDYQKFNNNYFSFLIQDELYYDFYIFDIIPLKNGYFIHCVTVIDTLTVSAFVITDRKNDKFFTRKLQKNKIYSLCLKKYNEKTIEPYWWSYRNIDVLIGEDNISIGFVGLFNYIYTTKNLNGLSYIDSIKVTKKLKKYVCEENNIKKTIEPFLKAGLTPCFSDRVIFNL